MGCGQTMLCLSLTHNYRLPKSHEIYKTPEKRNASLQLLRGKKLPRAEPSWQGTTATRLYASPVSGSASSDIPLAARSAFTPLLVHPLKTLVSFGTHLCKEFTDGKWQQYMASLVPVAISIGISYQLCIGLEFEIQMAVLRSFAQMLCLGFGLKFLGAESGLWSYLGIVIMVFLAGATAGEQAKELPKSQAVATISLVFGSLGTMVFMVLLHVLPSDSISLIAIFGHILGNAMIMVGRTLNGLHREISQHAGQIEAALALGATPYVTVQNYLREGFLNGMAPMIDAIRVMGLVSLPGNMTGLLLGGAAPVEAVISQVKLVNASFGAAAISCLVATMLGWHMLFTSNHQLQLVEGG